MRGLWFLLVLSEIDLWTTCVVLALVAGLYTAAGGLAAVVYTDMIQTVVLILGSCLMTYCVFSHEAIGGSWDTFVAAVGDPAKFSLINPEHRPLSDTNLPWLGTLIGVPILGFYFWVTNQYIVQRVLGAKTVDDARWGALLGASELPVLFIMVLPGLAFSVIWATETPGATGWGPSVSADGDDIAPSRSGWTGYRWAYRAIMSSIDSF